MKYLLVFAILFFSCSEKSNNVCGEIKYDNLFQKRHSQISFFDYEQALCVSEMENKPLLIVMGGWAVVRVNILEKNIFSDSVVSKFIDENYIVVHLYTDDKTILPEHEQYISRVDNSLINTIGKKSVEFQTLKFQTGSQPYISVLSSKEEVITEIPYTNNPDKFLEGLKSGIALNR